MGEDEQRKAFEREWAAWSAEVLSGMADWRTQHPRATFSEIEAELDARMARMRARLLERVAQQSAAMTWRSSISDRVPDREREEGAPRCPSCGAPLEPRGRHRRRLRTSGGQIVALEREYGVCPQCGQGLFPPG